MEFGLYTEKTPTNQNLNYSSPLDKLQFLLICHIKHKLLILLRKNNVFDF